MTLYGYDGVGEKPKECGGESGRTGTRQGQGPNELTAIEASWFDVGQKIRSLLLCTVIGSIIALDQTSWTPLTPRRKRQQWDENTPSRSRDDDQELLQITTGERLAKRPKYTTKRTDNEKLAYSITEPSFFDLPRASPVASCFETPSLNRAACGFHSNFQLNVTAPRESHTTLSNRGGFCSVRVYARVVIEYLSFRSIPPHTFHTGTFSSTYYDSISEAICPGKFPFPVVAVLLDDGALFAHPDTSLMGMGQIQVGKKVARHQAHWFPMSTSSFRAIRSLRISPHSLFAIRIRPSSEETTPLLPGKTRRTISRDRCKFITYGLLALLAFLFVSVNLYLHLFNCPLYPGTMNTIRREWEKEGAQHDLVREEWRLKKQEHGAIEEGWKLQTEWHERDVARRIREEEERRERVRQESAQELERHARKVEEYEKVIARRVREEDERQERVRQEWAQEFERHAREVEEYEKAVVRRVREEQERQASARKEWNQEVREHEKEVSRGMQEEEERKERIREEWDQEVERHRHECEEMERHENQRQENERQKWRREVEDHDQIEEERRKREEEERQKLNMFWGGVEALTCTTYATREYTAQLMNLPATWEHRVEACKATPLEVHGTSYLPKTCEDKVGGVN